MTAEHQITKICKVLCQSGKFETGQGTCAPLCMSQLGKARKSCQYREKVFEKLAKQILKELNSDPHPEAEKESVKGKDSIKNPASSIQELFNRSRKP